MSIWPIYIHLNNSSAVRWVYYAVSAESGKKTRNTWANNEKCGTNSGDTTDYIVKGHSKNAELESWALKAGWTHTEWGQSSTNHNHPKPQLCHMLTDNQSIDTVVKHDFVKHDVRWLFEHRSGGCKTVCIFSGCASLMVLRYCRSDQVDVIIT